MPHILQTIIAMHAAGQSRNTSPPALHASSSPGAWRALRPRLPQTCAVSGVQREPESQGQDEEQERGEQQRRPHPVVLARGRNVAALHVLSSAGDCHYYYCMS